MPRQVDLDDVAIDLDGVDVTDAFAPGEERRSLEGLVTGLDLGDNLLTVTAAGSGVPPASITLVDHPTSGPIFSGPQQQPFVCTTARGRFDGRSARAAARRQPGLDRHPGRARGRPAAATRGRPRLSDRRPPRSSAGATTARANARVDHVYRTTGGQFRWLDDPTGPLPADIATTTTLDGRPCRSSCAGSAARSTASSTASPCSPRGRARSGEPGRVALERTARLQLPGRRRHRPLPGDHEHRRHAPRVAPGRRLRGGVVERHRAPTRTTTSSSAARPR